MCYSVLKTITITTQTSNVSFSNSSKLWKYGSLTSLEAWSNSQNVTFINLDLSIIECPYTELPSNKML